MKRGNRNLIAVTLLILLGILVLFFWRATTREPYDCMDCNLIIISATNLRADHLGAYGYNRDTSPKMDNLAENSLVFEDAYAQASWTLPSGASLLTSLYPYEHNVMNRLSGVPAYPDLLSPDIVTLSDVLKKNGYETAIFSGGFDYSPRYGVITRFDKVVTAPENKFNVFGYGTLNSTVPTAIKWLIENKDEKFFLFVQGFDAHCPFNPPNEFDKFTSDYNGPIDRNKCYVTFNETEPIKANGTKYYIVNSTSLNKTTLSIMYDNALIDEQDIKYLVDSYDGEIRFADAMIGELLKTLRELGLSDKTIIVIVSEHGDMFGKHGKFMRGGITRGIFYDDVLHVPLIIKHPNLEPKRVEGLSQLIDVMPTLLDFLNVKTNAELQGKSLMPLIANGEQVNEHVFAGMIFKPGPQNIFFKQPTRLDSIRNNDWKLIREIVYSAEIPHTIESTSYELYNLKEDPEELKNAYGEDQNVFSELNSKLLEWFNQMVVDPYELE